MPPPSPPTPAPTLVSRTAPSTIHLDPGTTLATRYRIVTHLGKGGMGEVYRADDLTLGVPVALKFLPPSLALDPLRLEHFRTEVRLARQVSHANVCRVYDIGETPATADSPGQVFISMEFVDGEDLASLLRRIGRLPSEKAVHIARQLCFGLAAAHEQGIIHRDLKPANIMIDGRGNARIMDFGIADAAESLAQHRGQHAGTPGYMSPEQLSGSKGGLTKRSDLYSLGLVLYELFTGRPAFTATAVDELRRLQSSAANLTRPSTLVGDLDPAIERAILRCLEPDPNDRPPSAMAIAAALPGGDPLAAALAAGETPSPELIAAAGGAPVLSPIQAWIRVAIVAAMIIAMIAITASWSMVSRVKPAKTPEVLRDHASEIIHALGYPDPPADSAGGFNPRYSFISRINLDKDITDKAARLNNRPGPYEFWYRQSPTTITATDSGGAVEQLSPFPQIPGEIIFRSDSAGRLEYFAAVPPRRREGPASDPPPQQVQQLFRWAELDSAQFKPADPIIRPFLPVDSLQSWTGTHPDIPDLPIRIHIGTVEGRVTYFNVSYPWAIPGPEAKSQPRPFWSPYDFGSAAIVSAIILVTCFLAAKSLRSGRGDRAAALRLAVVMFFCALVGILATQHHFPTFRSILFSGQGVIYPVFAAIELWLFYTALEPYARRIHPHTLVSWTRLLRGSFDDPVVGRHMLLGMLIGAACALGTAIFADINRGLAAPGHYIAFYGRTFSYTTGFRGLTIGTAESFVTALILGVGSMLPLVAGQLIFRLRLAGYIALGLCIAALELDTLRNNPVEGVASVMIACLPIGAIPRGGLLALVVTHLTRYLAQHLVVGFDWTHWFTQPAFIPAIILLALAIFAARAATAGRALSI